MVRQVRERIFRSVPNLILATEAKQTLEKQQCHVELFTSMDIFPNSEKSGYKGKCKAHSSRSYSLYKRAVYVSETELP